MTDKRTWKDLWKSTNALRDGETAAEYGARAEHAWTTHNEDPGAGIVTPGGDDHGLYFTEDHAGALPEPPAGDAGPIPAVAEEAAEPVILTHAAIENGNVVDTQIMVEGFGAVAPAAPDHKMIDVPCAPGYRVNRPLYSAMWFFYRPGETVPQGSFPNGGLAMNAAVDDHNAVLEIKLGNARPIGRTVDDPAPEDGDFPYGYYAAKHKATGLWSTFRKNDTAGGALVKGGLGTREDAKDAAALDYAERNLSRSEVETVAARIAKKGLVAARERRPRHSAAVVPLTCRVVLESPYAGDVERNVDYARQAMADCLSRGEAPFASHLLYTQLGVLDDTNAEERKRGIEAGFKHADEIGKAVFYMDYGMSPGMAAALVRFARARKVIEFRFLGLKDGSDMAEEGFDL